MSSEHRPDDRELDDFLEGRSSLSAAYREASRGQAAPPQLEAAVLAQAREAAAASARRPAHRALQPLAYAASFVLAMGVVLSLWRNPATQSPALPPVASVEPRQESAAVESSPPAPEAPAPSSAVAASAAAPMAQQQAAASAELHREAQARQRLQDAPKVLAAPRAVPAPASEDDPAAGASLAAPEPAADSMLVPPPPPPAAAETQAESLREIAPTSAPRLKRLAPPTDAEPAGPGLDARIAELRDLRDDGDLERLKKALAAFRADYPQAELPEDLRSLETPPPAAE